MKINPRNHRRVVTYLFQPHCYRSLVIWNLCICILYFITLCNEVKIPYMTGANGMISLGLVIWTCVLSYLYCQNIVK